MNREELPKTLKPSELEEFSTTAYKSLKINFEKDVNRALDELKEKQEMYKKFMNNEYDIKIYEDEDNNISYELKIDNE